MSKSLGNFFTVRDLLDQGVPGEVIRFVFLSTHYRKPMDWTRKKADTAKNHLVRMWQKVGPVETQVASKSIPIEFMNSLANDLDTHGAIQVLFKLEKEGRIEELTASGHILGLFGSNETYEQLMAEPTISDDVRDAMIEVIWHWAELRNASDYIAADKLRDKLLTFGIQPQWAKEGESNWIIRYPDVFSDIENSELLGELNVILEALN